MVGLIEYLSDKFIGGGGTVHGSDGRLNVSSRADTRGYYNSRDESESFVLPFFDANATIADEVVYLKNDKQDKKHMVMQDIHFRGEVASSWELVMVTGTAADGTVATPLQLNQAGESNPAQGTFMTVTDSGSTPITGLTVGVLIGTGVCDALGEGDITILHGEQVRLGPGQACALLMRTGTADSYVYGEVRFFFEDGKA